MAFFSCNIDRHGRIAWCIWGVVMLLLAAGVAGLIAADRLASAWWWAAVGGLALLGVASLVEARKGWCIMRAMGFKTPM